MRCPLLVPCDADGGLDVALSAGADAVVLDLGDAPSPPARDAARRRAAGFLAEARAHGSGPALVLRVAALASGLVDADLDAVAAAAPDAVLLPGVVGGQDIQHLAAKLAVREAEAGLPAGHIRILAMAADTAWGALALHTVPGASTRLAALGWDPRALAAEAGAWPDRDAAPCRTARGLLLLAAAAAGVPALDAPSPPGSLDLGGACRAARREGFAGKLARHADQVATVLACFAERAG